MKYFYSLYHVYEQDEDEVVKIIGIFTSKKKAKQVIDELFTKPGFNEHPKDCFVIDRDVIDRVGWGEGFVTYDEAYDYITKNEMYEELFGTGDTEQE